MVGAEIWMKGRGSTALVHLVDDGTGVLGGHIHHQALDGLAQDAVDLLEQHTGRRHLELIAFPAHGLH